MTDTLKWYLHEPFMLGADVPDGREGRVSVLGSWQPAEHCRERPNVIHETRPVPERMVTLPPLPESVVRLLANGPGRDSVSTACRAAVEQLDGGS